MGQGLRNASGYCDALYSTAFSARLCPDILLRAFEKAYPVHRVILASQSAYFAALLRWVSWQPAHHRHSSEDEEGAGLPSHELLLGEDVTQRGFEWLLEYFYAAPDLAITNDNAFDVLAAAHYLGVTPVQTACVDFLSQHLNPDNLCACLGWASRADHGEASDMLAAACRRVLALRLPRNLAAWAPALPHIEPHTLLDILACDHLAVTTEHDRYLLVREVAALLHDAAAAAAEAAAAGGDGDGDGEGDEAGGVATGGDGGGVAEVQRMLSSALHVSDARLARLHLARSCPAAIPCSRPAAAAAAAGIGGNSGGGGSSSTASLGTSPSDCCAGGASFGPSSQASSRSLARSSGSVATGEEESLLRCACQAAAKGRLLRQAAVEGGYQFPAQSAPAGSASATAPLSGTSATAALEERAQLLLQEAVRYEHLTVPQLMAVQHEGLVRPELLRQALWERTQLDYSVFSKLPESEARARAPADAAASQPPGTQERPFRFCWRLPCSDLKKLQVHNTLQSELHQYAGALWRARLCCSGGAAASEGGGGSIGLYVGRHLQPLVTHGSTHAHALNHGHDDHGPALPPRRPPRRQPHNRQEQQQQHTTAFCSFADRSPTLRSRCRVAVWQADNTAMQGRLCLGDSGDFVANFAAGGYFGQGRLVQRSDLYALPDDADVYVFVFLDALVGDIESGMCK